VNQIYQVLDKETLEAIASKHPELKAEVEAELARRIEADEQAKLTEVFTKAIEAFVSKLPNPPKHIHNVFCGWALDDKGKGKWLVTTNHVCLSAVVVKGKGKNGKASYSNAVKVYKVDTEPPTFIGNFKSGHEACVLLKLDDDGNSANRVLVANGYAISKYTGSDFTQVNVAKVQTEATTS